MLGCLLAAGALLCGCVDREVAIARHMARAQAHLEAERYEKARIELRNVIRLEPDDARARWLLGRVAEGNGAWRKAYQHYQAATLADPRLVEAQVALAGLLLRFAEVERAEQHVRSALAVEPAHPEALALSGWIALRRDAREEAAAFASRALAQDASSLTALALEVELRRGDGRVDEAVALLENAAGAAPEDVDTLRLLVRTLSGEGRHAEAVTWQQRVVALDPTQVRHHVTLASLHAVAGQREAAAAVLREACETLDDPAAARALAELVVSRFPQPEVAPTLRSLVSRFPDEASFPLVLASHLERSGQIDEGMRVLRTLLGRASEVPVLLEGRVQLARLHLLADEPRAARELVEEVLEKNPRDVDALVLRARLARAEGAPEQAIVDLRLALDAGERVAELQRLLAEAYADAGQLDFAVTAMQAAVEAAPEAMAYRLVLAQLALRTGDAQMARDEIDALLGAGVDSPQLLELAFLVYEQLGALDRAATLAARMVERYPSLAAGHYLQGRVLHRRQRFAEARDAYERAMALGPEAPQILEGLVRAQLALGEQAAALALIEEATARDPEDAQAHLLLGEVLGWMGQTARAAEVFAALISRHPKRFEPYTKLAALQHGDGDDEAARSTLEAGLEATDWHPRIAEQLAGLHLRDGRADAAIAVFDALHERHPQLDAVANNLAMLLATHREDPESLARAVALVEPFSDSDNPAYLDTAGWVMLKQGQADVAVELLQRAVKAAPQRPTQRYHLAVAYLEKGDENAALRQLDLALASGQPFAEREAARRRRERLAEASAVPDL